MNKRGYTLMEVSLFLAISGMLTLVAIVGIGPRLTNVRFSTGMRDIQNNLTKTLSASESGQNFDSRSFKCSLTNTGSLSGGTLSVASPGIGDGSCIFIGVIAILQKPPANQIVYRQIIASRTPKPIIACSGDTFQLISQCYQARILPDTVPGSPSQTPRSFVYPNGISQDNTVETRAFGYIKSPATNTTYRFSMTGTIFYYAGPSLFNPSIKYNQVNNMPADTFPVCYRLNNRTATLYLHQNSADIVLRFNEDCPL